MNLNPSRRITESQGVDLPIMYVYLGGRIAGNCIEKCLGWRQEIVKHYKEYKTDGEGYATSYPISFLCPLNSGESTSVDKLGLTSSIPPNLIYHKDLLSVEKADVVIANVEDYFEIGIEQYLYEIPHDNDLRDAYNALRDKILNRRENFGTICEISWALYLNKPLILIAPESRKTIYEKHPFAKRASVIVTSVKELLDNKWLQILYKSLSSAEY